MENLSPIQKLDEILLTLSKEIDSISTITLSEKYEISKIEMAEILHKLIEENLIRQVEIGMVGHTWYEHLITFDGRLFIEAGGYVKKKEIDDLNESVFVQNERRIVRNETLLLRGTWAAAIVGALVLIWQIFLYFYPTHKDYSYWIWETIPKRK